MQDVLTWAMCEAAAHAYPAPRAHDELKALWGTAKPEAAPHEWRDMLRWAIRQAEADDPNKRRARMMREYGSHHTDAINAAVTSPDFGFEAFWESSDQLRDLRQFARARLVGPWAMLGATLARVIAHIPPHVVLPPIVGSYASLNLFVALVGRSGESKSASMSASADWLSVEPDYPPLKPGSGEGLAKCFAYVRKIPVGNGQGGGYEQIGKRWTVLAQIPEVDTLTATGGRGGSTIMSSLREGWSGERLGTDYANDKKRIMLQEHRYRLCLIVGVQPLRAQPLFDDADGGTPQRFVWFSAADHDMPDVEPPEPAKLDLGRWERMAQLAANPNIVSPVSLDTDRNWKLSDSPDPADFEVLSVPDAAIAEIKATQRAIRRRHADVDPLDGHRQLVQLKIAAGLMALEGRRQTVAESDWQRAGVVMAHSDFTRRKAQSDLRSKAKAENTHRGRSEGERELAKMEVIDEDRRVKNMANRILQSLRAKDGQTVSVLRKSLSGGSRNRDVCDKAVSHLDSTGAVRSEPFTARNGQESARLWLT